MNRQDFPFFQTDAKQLDPSARVSKTGQIIYLDSSATSQMPQTVLDAEIQFQQFYRANVHRAIHWMSDYSTEKMEAVRNDVAGLLNCKSTEVIFTRGATESINIVAHGLKPDHVVCSVMEHHANIVPWQMNNATMHVIELNEDFQLEQAERVIQSVPSSSVFAISGASNVLGTKTPLKSLIKIAKEHGLITVVDASQLVVHERIDVKDLDCDFLAFSGHKLYGPTGIGVLYGKEHLLEDLPPMLGGGEMISTVSFDRSEFNQLPFKFEAGTPNIGGVIGLGKAVEYFVEHFAQMIVHEQLMKSYTAERLFEAGVNVYGPEDLSAKVPVFAFNIPDVHCHDVSQLLDQQGIAIRSGYHCAEPLHKYLNVPGSCRVSLAMYSEPNDIDVLCEALEKVRGFF